ncbi:MAG TPA: glycoside hydrolase family 3 N-terminal domain-containing protein [Gemmatimonadales bacterium]|nr:glycoside hydrolase family 3 N-terminal domain-containing protein [Gemmatimonadales bacterium]
MPGADAALGRLIIPALRWRPDTGFAHEGPLIAGALAIGAGGFIVFGGTADAVRTLTADLVRRAHRPLLIGSDIERGAGQQVAGLSELPPPLALASLGDLDVIRWAGARTGADARSVGINWAFAPVADLDVLPENPIVQTRSFGADPARVAACVRAWVEGCQSAGALACAKHYPGHGRTARDSHVALPEVDADAATLSAGDLRPFAEAARAGVATVMTAHVAYAALDPSRRPATMSPPILRQLRESLGFDGLVVTDALIMEGARAGRSEGEAAVEAIRAGVDLLLYPGDPAAVHDALARAIDAGRLEPARVREARRRYVHALERAERPVVPPRAGPWVSPDALADALLDRGLVRGRMSPLPPPIECVVVDDDVGGPYAPSPAGYVEAELKRRGLSLRLAVNRAGSRTSTRVVLAFNGPRGWKGRASFSAESAAALAREAPDAGLVVLFGHPRLVAEIPGPAPVLIAWHRQRLMQEAVARWIAAKA